MLGIAGGWKAIIPGIILDTIAVLLDIQVVGELVLVGRVTVDTILVVMAVVIDEFD
jgi:hypothetical protein